jgi:uncharacterized membrane protein
MRCSPVARTPTRELAAVDGICRDALAIELIASLGCDGDSAVVVGDTLMTPIIAIAYGLPVTQQHVAPRAIATVAVGIAVTVSIAAGAERLFGLGGPTTEILARTRPSLLA